MAAVWEHFVDFLSENAVTFALNLVLGCVILFVGFRLVRLLTKLFQRSKAGERMDPTARSFIESLGGFLLRALLIIIFAGIVGIPTASIIALLGSVGVAIGLAMQGSLSNLAGGVMILLFKPFAKGDYITVSDAERGTVTDISIFYTTVVTLDNRRIVIPNGTVSNSTVTNHSAVGTRRIELCFSAAYEASSDAVRKTILDAVAERERLLPDPAPEVILKSMQDSAVEYELHCWCKTEDYLSECNALRELVKKRFDENGVSIPFPQVDVHMK